MAYYSGVILTSQFFTSSSFKRDFASFVFIASASYCLGRVNGDCWFLYTLNHADNNNLEIKQPDQTLEILMSDLDSSCMTHFQLHDEHGREKSTDLVTKVTDSYDRVAAAIEKLNSRTF